MKVAIFTIYDFSNHGNRLQNFALEKVLKSLGHDVTTYFFSPKKIYKYLSPFTNLMFFVPNCARMRKSKNHTKKTMNCVNLDHFSKKKINKLSNEFDAFVIGSDQVWNPKYMANKDVSFLNFADGKKCIAYAPSFGVDKLNYAHGGGLRVLSKAV